MNCVLALWQMSWGGWGGTHVPMGLSSQLPLSRGFVPHRNLTSPWESHWFPHGNPIAIPLEPHRCSLGMLLLSQNDPSHGSSQEDPTGSPLEPHCCPVAFSAALRADPGSTPMKDSHRNPPGTTHTATPWDRCVPRIPETPPPPPPCALEIFVPPHLPHIRGAPAPFFALIP